MKSLYAVSVELDAQQSVARILKELHKRLVPKEGSFDFERLMRSGRFEMERGGRLEVAIASRAAGEEDPYLHAVRYSHPDRVLSGRRWITELGLTARERDPWICASIVLGYEDVVRTDAPAPNPTRPLIVPRLLEHCKPNPDRGGREIESIGATALVVLRDRLMSKSRKAPVVIVARDELEDPSLYILSETSQPHRVRVEARVARDPDGAALPRLHGRRGYPRRRRAVRGRCALAERLLGASR